MRILGLIFLFIQNCGKKHGFDLLKARHFSNALDVLNKGKYVVFPTKVRLNAPKIAVVHLSKSILDAAKSLFFPQSSIGSETLP